MYRYIEENKERSELINPNCWWNIFGEEVKTFHFAFLSGEFTGGFRDRLNHISMRSGIKGAAVNSANLLLMAEKLKAGTMGYEEFFRFFDTNDEILFLNQS